MKHLALSIAALALASSGLARAAVPESRDIVSTPPEGKPGAFEHDGFYFRFGGGFSPTGTAVQSERENVANENSEGTIAGYGPVGELMIGGTVAKRLIVGGGVWASMVTSTNFDQQNGNPVPNELRDPDWFVLTGPFVDWYWGASVGHRLGAGGFHMQGGTGFAMLAGHLLPEDEEQVAVGGGVMFGIGYDWWVHEQWKLGLLGRITMAGLIDEDVRNETWYHGVASLPSLLLTATYN